MTNVDTETRTSWTVSGFYDVIGRIGIISVSEVHSRRSQILTASVNMKSASLEHRACLIMSCLLPKFDIQ